MARPIYVPQAGRFVNFSDTASNDDIKSYIRTNFPKPQPVEVAAAEVAPAEAKYSNAGLGSLLSAGFAESFTDIPGGISSIMTSEDTAASRMSDEAKKKIRENLGIKEGEEWTIPQYGAYIAGQIGGLLVPGTGEAAGLSKILQGTGKVAQIARGLLTAEEAATGAQKLNLAGKLAKPVTLTQAGALQAQESRNKIEQQRAAGMEITPEQQLATARGNFGVGLMSLVSLERFAGPLAGILTKVPAKYAPIAEKIISNRLSRIAGSATMEGGQEAIEGIASDLIEKGIYNPDAQVGQDIFTNAAGGAFGGTLIEGIVQLAAGRKLRGYRQLQKDLAAESSQNLSDLNQASVAQAAEGLRATGVEGPLNIEPNEDPDGAIRYTITTPAGKPLVDTYSEAEANAAVDLYRQTTGAKVSVNTTQAPKLAGVRIGNTRFPSIEAADKARQSVRQQVRDLDSYFNNIELVSRHAAEKGVAPGIYAKQIDETLRSARNKLAQFDAYFEAPGVEPVKPGPTITPPAPTEKAAEAAVAPVAPVAAPIAPVAPVASAEASVAPEIPAEAPSGIAAIETPEPITEEEQVPEMPIGAIELPVEESRILPDTIVDEEVAPEILDQPAPTQIVQRPSATDEQLTALKTELFGKPIGYSEMSSEQQSLYDAERDRRYPPQDTEVYLSAGPTGTKAPRTLREAEITNPIERDYTPERKEWMKKLYAGVQDRIEAIAPGAAKAEFKTLIESDPGYLIRGQERGIETQYGIKSIIDLSIGILKPGMSVEDAVNQLVDIVNHEIIHVLTRKGVLRPEEWRMLSRAVANTNVPGKKYTYLDKAEAVYTPNGIPISKEYANPEAVVEEAVAEMYRDWVKNKKAPQPVVGLFNRITEFFRRIFRALRDANYDKVFQQIEAGEVGKRTGEAATTGARMSAAPLPSAAPGQPLSTDLSDRNGKAFGLYPYLRTASPQYYDHKRLILGDTNPGNAASQIAELDALLSRHPNTLRSREAFARYLADAQGRMATPENGVPIVPYKAVRFANDPALVARQIGRLTPGQLAMADSGLSAALDLKNAYINGTATPVHTAKLILWGILSRGVSPFVQESMFLDVVAPRGLSNRTGRMAGGIDPFIIDAIEGNFDLDAYMDYVKTLKIDGLPGAGTTHNLGAFGKTTLVKLQRRLPDGRTLLQYLHDLISDYSLSGKEVRRKFHEVNTGIGINNKVLSFALLVSGRDDVLVLDRVQMRNQFNDGNFNDYNLYDGVKIERPVLDEDGNPVLDRKGNPKIDSVAETGTGIAPIGDGVFGLMYYEALERDLAASVRQAYNMLGRGNQFSMGRYHWESWVASSAQEVDHGSVSGLIKDALGESDPYANIYTGEGKYDTYNSGIKYGYTKNGEAYVALPDGLGAHYYFTPEYAKKVVAGYDRRSTGIISDPTFKVSESIQGAWYDRPEVNKQNLRRYLLQHRDAFAEQRRLGSRQTVRGAGKGDTAGSGPGPVHAIGRRGGVRQPQVGDVKRNAQSIADKYISRTGEGVKFSAAPLPPYMAQQNETLFAKEEKVPILDKMARHFSGQRPLGKTLRTLHYGDIEIGKWEMAGLSGRAAAVDSAAYMKHIESLLNQKQTGNYQRMGADTSATAALMWRRRSGHLTASMMLRGKLALSFQTPGDIMSATMKVENDPDNLKEIFKVMNEEGPLNPSTGERDTKGVIFRSYAVAKRAEWLRSTGQSVPRELTPQYVREAIDLATREYPEVVEAYNKYQRFNKSLLTTARDAGLISDAELGRLTNQMNYYGFIYEVYGEPLGPTSSQKTGSKFKLRPYTGSGRGGLVNDPMFVMIQNAQFWVDSIAKNLASYKSFEVARQMGEARLLQTGEAPDELAGEAPDVMFFSKDGVVKRFAVKDPLLVTALGSDDRITVGKFWDTIGVPAHILRESVTRDPGFMARNLLRDTVSSWITSGVDFMPVIDTLKGFSTALKTGTSFEELSARGVVGSYDLAMMGPGEIADVFKRNAMPLNVKTVTSVGGLNAVARSLWNRMGHVSEASDAATRIAVYDALRKQGMSEAEAATQAIELLDFTRRGASQTLGILTKLIPFLNARIQGMDVLYQAGRSGIRYATGRSRGEQDANVGKKFLVRGAMLASIAIALEMMNQGDDDYEQLDDYVKNGNLLVPLKHFGLKGQFLAIPKPFEAGLIFATFPQQIYKTVTGEASGRENAELFFSQLSSTFGVNPIPQALLPGVEILTNHSFYTGLPLVSEGKSRLAPELQYNTNTSQLAMMIGGLPIFYDFTTGKFGGMSPIVVDKLISGYAGPMGTYMVEGVSLLMEDSNVGPDRMPREISNLPVVKSFFVDVKKKNPKVVTQAYELFRIADEANRTMSRLKQMRDVEALTEYVSENKDILRYKKYIFKLADNLNKLSAQERSIERDSTMTRDEKLAAQYKLRETRIRLASKVDEINKVLGR